MSEPTACTKCDGKGAIVGFEHIENGVCFACGGSGVVKISAGRLSQSQRVARNRDRNAQLAADDPQLAAEWFELNRTGHPLFAQAKAALHGAATYGDGLIAMRSAMGADR